MNKVRTIIVVILASLIEFTILSRIEIFGQSLDIIPAVVVGLSLGFGSLTGGYAGLFMGLCQDVLFSSLLGPRALLYFILAFIIGEKSYKFNVKHIATGMALSAIFTIIVYLVSFALAYFGQEDLVLLDCLKQMLVSTIINGLIYYPVIKIFNKIFVFPDIVFSR